MALVRTGVALDFELLKRFDRLMRNKGYANRSEALRDLIRDHLNDASLQGGEVFVVGAVALVYDHHSRLLPDKLMELQHEYHSIIISTVHSHLDHEMCLEVVVVKSPSAKVQELGNRLIGLKGIQHGKLVMSSHEAYASKAIKHAVHSDHQHRH